VQATARTASSPQNPLQASTGGCFILRRAIAECGDHSATPQDQIDCADTALALGQPAIARLLFDVAFLRLGLASSSKSSWNALAEQAGLWPSETIMSLSDRDAGNFALDVALRQLRELMALEDDLPTMAGLEEGDRANSVGARRWLPAPAEKSQEREFDTHAFVDLVGRLCGALRNGDLPALTAALDRVRTEILEPTPPEYAVHATGSILQEAAIGAVHHVRGFFLRHYHLCWAPFGSPALFAAASRLADGALGPYFSGVGRLLRSPRDLFGLIDLADEGGETERGLRLQRWFVLLATHVDHDTCVALTDEVADRGLTHALAGLLTMAQRLVDEYGPLLFMIRDAALDNRNLALAAEAQATITSLNIEEPREWIVLAEILATGGMKEASQAALTEALRLAPANRTAITRLKALASGNFEPFFTLAGFGSPSWRVALRARNRTLPPREGAVVE
jgi:hypothetical protein